MNEVMVRVGIRGNQIVKMNDYEKKSYEWGEGNATVLIEPKPSPHTDTSKPQK